MNLVKPFLLAATTAVSTPASLMAEDSCYGGFVMTDECIDKVGLQDKVNTFKQEIADAKVLLDTRYKIEFRVINNAVQGPYAFLPHGDVWIDPVLDNANRFESFIISAENEFLREQPNILFQYAARHEICHIVVGNIGRYHRNGKSGEAAVDKCVMNAVGEERYREYLHAFGIYKNLSDARVQEIFQIVKNVELVLPPVPNDSGPQP